jgi:hypothetical protein
VTETNVFQFTQPGTFADPLTEVLRTGARALLAQAVEPEVAALLDNHADKRTEDGRQRAGAPRASARARDHDRHRGGGGALPTRAKASISTCRRWPIGWGRRPPP